MRHFFTTTYTVTMFAIILLLASCLLSTAQTEVSYRCDFEESCEDFVFDNYWIVDNVSSHIDHTYKNLSGHYITYTNTSMSTPLTTFRTKDWIEPPSDKIGCLSQWMYSGPGGFDFKIEIAQGDDLQARIQVGRFGTNSTGRPGWDGFGIELTYATRYIPYVLFTHITGVLDLDDISVVSCPSTRPIPPIHKALECDFDQNVCPYLISLPNYSYSWSVVQAEEAQKYTAQAPATDYSVGDKTGHYIWLNNSDSLKSGGSGYINTPIFRFTRNDPIFCLSFQYYRFGLAFQTSKLTVLALEEGAEQSVEQIWPINPINYTYANNRWSWGYAPLRIGNYSLLFRMDSDDEVNSSFAIDSISVSSCEYQQQYLRRTSSLEFTCDFDSHDQPCNIGDDYFNVNPQSVINYTVASPRSISNEGLGPKQSSGWSGDWFLYWSRSQLTPSTLINGQFIISPIETNRDMCIRFAYFVNSTDVQPNEKNTKIFVLTRGYHTETLWSIELDNSFGWQLVTISLPSTASTQSIYFRITQQRPTPVAVAFDDITIAQCGSLNVLTTTVPPTTTTPFNKSSSIYNISIHLTIVLLLALKLSSLYE